MDAKRIVKAILKTIFTMAVIVVIGLAVYQLGAKAYNFGYRIFSEEPISPAPGLTMSVAIVEGKSVLEIGEILEEKGLIRNHYLFYFQEFFSNYHGQLKPGVYELCTAQTPEEMIEIMAASSEEETEEDILTEDEIDYGESYDMDDALSNPDRIDFSEDEDSATDEAEETAE